MPWYVHESQIGRADSTSPRDTARRRSGNVQATSLTGSSRGRAVVVTRRKVQRRSGVAASSVARTGSDEVGRGVIAIRGP